MGALDELMSQLSGQVRGPNGEAMPQTIPDAPNVADMYRNSGPTPAPTPDPSPSAPVKQGGGLRGFLGGALKNFLSGASQAGQEYAGINDANLKQAQQAHLNAQTAAMPVENAYKQTLTSHMQELIDSSKAGREQVPFIDPATGKTLMNENGEPVMMPRNANKSLLDYLGKRYSADQTFKGKELQFGMNMPLDERLANMINRPDLANQPVTKPMLDMITKQISTLGYGIKDFGQEGQWLTNKAGERVVRMGNSSSWDRMMAMGPRTTSVVVNGVPTTIATNQLPAGGLPTSSFDPSVAAAKASSVAFATGTESDQKQSFRTFAGHANDLYDASQQFSNSQSPWANKPINVLRQNAEGNAELSSYLAKIDPVRKEFESFLLNNRALYAEDRAEGQKILNENLSPKQMAASINSFMHTAAVRMGTLNRKWADAHGGQDDPTMVDPETSSILKKFGQGTTVDKYRNAPKAVMDRYNKAKKDPMGLR